MNKEKFTKAGIEPATSGIPFKEIMTKPESNLQISDNHTKEM